MTFLRISLRALHTFLLAGLLAIFGPALLAADEATADQDAAAAAETVSQGTSTAATSYWRDHFSLHGHLTLAYADLGLPRGEQRTTQLVLRGIEEGGTFPYGNAAINLRYEPAFGHSFVLQLAHREFGDSPLGDVVDEVQLDWLFYQFNVGDRGRLRLGRQPVPAGIFNEVRDVGVILPFFRAPLTFYREGALFTETVDGIGYQHQLFADSSWKIDISGYYGEYEIVEPGAGFTEGVKRLQATNTFGGQLWLKPPVEGLRFGLGAQRWTLGSESNFSTQPEDWGAWFASVDGEFDHFVIRGEYQRLGVTYDGGLLPGLENSIDLYYFQLGWLPTERWGFYMQPEYSDLTQRAPILLDGESRTRNVKDLGFSVVFAFSPSLVIKAEHHDLDVSEPVGQSFVFTPQGPRIQPLYRFIGSSYSILSLSVSF